MTLVFMARSAPLRRGAGATRRADRRHSRLRAGGQVPPRTWPRRSSPRRSAGPPRVLDRRAPPYGFRRGLVRVDGTVVREWPRASTSRWPGTTSPGSPPPKPSWPSADASSACWRRCPPPESQPTRPRVSRPRRRAARKDGGVGHATSGVWHQTTVINIARNPLIGGVARTAAGQWATNSGSPRTARGHLEDADYRLDGKPKVVANPDGGPSRPRPGSTPWSTRSDHRRLQQTLDARGGSQRGKPRSRDPERNPLGTRIFDMACGWPMYRKPYSGSFRYTCGLYQQSHGASACTTSLAGRWRPGSC